MDKKKPLITQLVSQVFFLFNFVGIMPPLAITNFLAIFGYKYLLSPKFLKILGSVSLLAIVFAAVHISNGVDMLYYIRSTAYYFALFITSFIGFKYLRQNRLFVEKAFRLSCITTFLLFAASLLLYSSDFSYFFWKSHDFVGTGNVFQRYKGLSYEPSHFALIATPLVMYSFLNLYKDFSIKNTLLFLAVFVPVLLTISFGFVGAFFIGFLAVLAFVYLKYRRIERFFLVLLTISVLGSALVMPLSDGLRERIVKIYNGHDTSVNGRTHQAFYLGYRCAEEKSLLFGAGAGQIKVIGEEVIRPYYAAWDPVGYSKENWPVMAIPNVTAETLAMYGILGLLLRIGLQLYLFIRMRVYRNYFNLFLFCFMFSYQLMGSFFTSTAEAILWVMCLVRMFPQFDIVERKKELK